MRTLWLAGLAIAASASASIDNSDIAKLIGLAKAQHTLAVSSKAMIDAVCHTDPDASRKIIRDADAAADAWKNTHATDQAKSERGMCLQALLDVRGMAVNCTARTYSTVWEEHDARIYHEDLRDCSALLSHPPR